jgi:hypothetical protein
MIKPLLYFTTWLPLFIVLFGAIRSKSWNDPVNLILFIHSLGFIMDAINFSRFFGDALHRLAGNIFAYVFVVLTLGYYFLCIVNRMKNSKFLRISMGFSVTILTYTTFFVDDVNQYAFLSWSIGNIIVIIFSIWMLVEEGRNLSTPIARKSLFWISLGSLVFAVGSILDFSIRHLALQMDNPAKIYQVILVQLIIVNLILYSLTIKGVWEAGRKT